MEKKIVAFMGSYRKGGITDQAVDAILETARANGAEVRKVYLTDTKIEFCLNCRKCMADSREKPRGVCVHRDDMESLLAEIDSATGLVLASPVNFGSVTALMKRFIERLSVYGYWPWAQMAPAGRKQPPKKAVLITSTAAPSFIGFLPARAAFSVMDMGAKVMGAKVVQKVYFGLACRQEKQKLSSRQLSIARKAGQKLI